MRNLLAGIAAVLLTSGAQAEATAYRAESRHFIIYAEENPSDLRNFADKLERFDKAVRTARSMDDPPQGDRNRLTVFVVQSDADVQKLIDDKTGYVRGFYIPRASGSVAFVPRKSGSGDRWDLDADTVFFHEYSHHLMMQDLDSPVPAWLVEGFAEFMSTASFNRNGSVRLGLPPKARAYSLFLGSKIPIERLLAGSLPPRGSAEHESLYARGWLLTHYLTFEPSRRGQLEKYLQGIASGVAPIQAAQTAFGDLRRLDKDLDNYVLRPKLEVVDVAASISASPIDIQPLSPGAAAALPLRAQSKRGVDAQTSEPLAARIRSVEGRYPADEFVELTLAEAELDARHADAAEAAADRALKADPRSTEAMIDKGRAIATRAQGLQEPSRHVAFEQARHLFIAANKIDTEDPQALMMFYRTFLMEGLKPSANAIAALHYASDLAPQDKGLRMTSAERYLLDGKYDEAKRALTPIAYDPHGSELATVARTMIENIGRGDVKAALAGGAAGGSVGSSPQ